MRDRETVEIWVAAYEHQKWQELLKLPPNSKCIEKEKLAFSLAKARVPLDGNKTQGYVTLIERNWFQP